MRHRLWQRMTAVLLMSILVRGSVYAAPVRGAEKERAATAGAILPAAAEKTQTFPQVSYSERFSAQKKPRIAVLKFKDENSDAHKPIYSASISAMLVTFLKRKSQFTVVERDRMGDILKEWDLGRIGRTNRTPSRNENEILEGIDAVIMGSVTLLNAPLSVEVATKNGKPAGGSPANQGNDLRVEIDIKALGRDDGRIIAAAKSSGPIPCLRSIVERLGASLEEGFLRPYYGGFQFTLSQPNNVRIFLTPILWDKAPVDAKPPVERSHTFIQRAANDRVESWTTDPNSYTTRNLLAGWYTMRLERPGYTSIGIENGNERFEARLLNDKVTIFYSERDPISGQRLGEPIPLAKLPEELQRFVVHVKPREVTVIDGDERGFQMAKEGGSLAPRIRRQLIDRGFDHEPQRVVLIGRGGLDLNGVDTLEEYADDETCDLFEESTARRPSLAPVIVSPNERFNFEGFQGGDLIIENYRGERVPTGVYQIAFWEPGHKLFEGLTVINHGDEGRPHLVELERKSAPLDLSTTGFSKRHDLHLIGNSTKYQADLSLDFDALEGGLDLPVDQYQISTDIPGLTGWTRQVELTPSLDFPPRYDRQKNEEQESQLQEELSTLRGSVGEQKAQEIVKLKRLLMPIPLRLGSRVSRAENEESSRPHLRVKTRLAIGGRLTALSSLSPLTTEEYHLDEEIGALLDEVLNTKPSVAEDRDKPVTGLFRRIKRVPAAMVTRSRSAPIEEQEKDVVKEEDVAKAPNVEGLPSALAKQADTAKAEDPAALRKRLVERLEVIDLLLLDDDDMKRIRENPEVASIVAQFVASGGALFAFVSEPGDYGSIIGSPLSFKVERKKTARFQIEPGTVKLVNLQKVAKRVKVGARRRLPESEASPGGAWRVVAFTKNGTRPRIIEMGDPAQGGYVVLWLDRPALFRSRIRGHRIPIVEEVRAKLERRAVSWARYLMYRKYDGKGEDRDRAAQVLAVTPAGAGGS